MILNQMMYGAGIGAQIKNNALFTMPDWYMAGLAAYIATGWNTEVDNLVRDGILSGGYARFNRLTGIESVRAGHSLWNYIAIRYGKQAIPNIVYMARMSRNIERGFQYVLGIRFETLLAEWIAFYKRRYTLPVDDRKDPVGDRINRRAKADRVYRQLKVSSDGKQAAWVTHQLGVYKVFILNRETGKKRRVFRGGYRLAERPDETFPVLSWHPSGEILAILTERKGESWLYFYDLIAKEKPHQILYNFQKILDISYSNDGRLLAMSAVQKGQSDLFVFDIASGSHEQLTNDLYNDFNPRFLPGSAGIIFSSNRVSDTVRFYEETDIGKLTFANDIFVYDYQRKSPVLKRITHTPLVNEIQPMAWPDGYMCYLSDENGIYNRFVARFDSAVSFVDTVTHYRYFTHAYPVTNYRHSILEQDGSLTGALMAEVIAGTPDAGMFIGEMIPPRYLKPVSLAPSYVLPPLPSLAEVQDSIAKVDTASVDKPLFNEPEKPHFRTVMLSDVVKEKEDSGITDSVAIKWRAIRYSTRTGPADTTGLQAPLRMPEKDTINKYKQAKALNYDVEYAVDEMVTQIDFTYLNTSYQPFNNGVQPVFINPGLNVLFMIGVTDLMEDYRLTGGIRLNFDLVNNEYLFSYTNNKRRLDHQILFHRSGVDDYGYYSLIRHKVNELYYILTYPFTPVLHIRGTASVRYDRGVYLSTDQYNLMKRDDNKVWGSIKGELVYDNTRSIGVNLYHGTRYKLFGEYYQMVNRAGNHVFVLGLDFRNYQKVHRSMIWANRLAASTSFGSDRLLYYMGGVDNWLWPRFDLSSPVAMDQDYVFQTLATNMRGFHQNIRNGNSFFVINSELRVPLFRYFFNRPIRSDILNNFQVVAFGDLGTAWTGPSPWSEENQLFTNYIYRNPLFIEVEMIKDPLVAGFGGGVRTRLLGYFLRADLAWGVEDGRVRKPVFYFSLSLDF